MKHFIFCAAAFVYFPLSYAQNSESSSAIPPDKTVASAMIVNEKFLQKEGKKPVYVTRFKTDAPIIAAGVGLTYLGVTLINDKKNLTADQVLAKSKSDVPFFDRSSVGWYSKKIDKDSYVPFQFSFTTLIIMLLINKNERQRAGQILVYVY